MSSFPFRVAVVAAFVFAGATQALAVCVSPTSTPSLYDKLVEWGSGDDKTVTIDLEQGTYAINVDIDQRGPGENSCCDSYGHNANLVIRGGYKPGTSCDPSQRSLDGTLTTLDGGGGNSRFFLWINGTASVSAVTFQNFTGTNGVEFFGLVGGSPTLKVDHVLGIGNQTMLFQASTTALQDVLVTVQPAAGLVPALQIVATDQYATATHLTVVGNGGAGLSVANQFGGNVPVSVFNSIFYNNASGDIVGYDAADNHDVNVYSSIAVISGNSNDDDYIPPGQAVDVIAADPKLQNYRPYPGTPGMSPAINAGTSAVIGGEPATDLEGNPRIVGGAPDMGAYESAVSYFQTYVVTTSADNGDNASPTTNSLRWAMANAKQSAAGQILPKTYRIAFDLSPSGCPPVLALNTAHALPDIDFDLTVDGTTQAGWQANTTFTGFDGVICIGLNGGDALPYAFHTVASDAFHVGRLSVLGLGFGGFTDAAIRLGAGSGHRIFGNRIGGVGVPVGLLYLHAANQDGVRITGSTGTSFVGAFDDASTRNVFADNTGIAVNVDSFVSASTAGSYIVNNLIGLADNGATPIANGSGIFVNGSPRNTIEYNTVSGSTGVGVTISGAAAQFNVLQHNMIGVPEVGSGSAANGTQGVVVNNGARNSTIGATRTSVDGGNLIASVAQGVYVSPSGGIGNLTNGNSYLVTSALPLDLGGVGQTANDALDADTGPNDLQNYPVLLHAYRTLKYEWIEGTLDTFANDAFRLDFYLKACCTGSYTAYDFLGRDSTGITDAAGHVHFWARIPAPEPGTPLAGVAAADSAVNGDTSEIGPAIAESTDMIFRDDFDRGP